LTLPIRSNYYALWEMRRPDPIIPESPTQSLYLWVM